MATGADIQVDKGGFVKIHYEILELLATAPLTGGEFRCLMFLFRKTYGFNKKEDKISLAQWAEGTGMKRQNVWSLLQTLLNRNIIYSISTGPKRAMTWGFNKYHEEWDAESVIADHDKSVMPQHDSSKPSVMPQHDKSVIPPHERTKDNKDSSSSGAAALSEKKPTVNFVQAYQDILGKMVESRHRSEEIQDWEKRIPYLAWEYALRETLDKGHRHDWKYTKSILERLEREGYEPKSQKPVPAPATLDFVLEDTYA